MRSSLTKLSYGGIPLPFQSPRRVAAVAELGSLGFAKHDRH
jgi:hypothetical protein